VGFHCVDCVAEGRRGTRRATTVAGAEPATGRPIAVLTLIGLNLAVFVATVVQSGSLLSNERAPLFQQWALVPGLVAQGEWWRVVTSGFLHFGPLHILFNMWALWVIGKDLEVVLGRTRFLAVYGVSLLGGSAAVMLFYAPGSYVAGASGAVFGLMGGLAVVLLRVRAPVGQVIMLIVINLVISRLVPGVSLVGHIGGMVVGALAVAALVYAPQRNRTAIQVGALTGLTVAAVVAMAVAADMF
jgi:membrane associated rhomboid family serine protease